MSNFNPLESEIAIELGRLLGLDGESPNYKELIDDPVQLRPAFALVSFDPSSVFVSSPVS